MPRYIGLNEDAAGALNRIRHLTFAKKELAGRGLEIVVPNPAFLAWAVIDPVALIVGDPFEVGFMLADGDIGIAAEGHLAPGAADNPPAIPEGHPPPALGRPAR